MENKGVSFLAANKIETTDAIIVMILSKFIIQKYE